MSRRSKNKQIANDWIAKCLATGVAISRSDDFYEIVEQFILRDVHLAYLVRQIEGFLPKGFSVSTVLSQDKGCLFIFTSHWKAAVEKTWAQDGVACYQFWFAEPNKGSKIEKSIRLMEMNITATAVEKAFLVIDHATHLSLTYVSAKKRDFEIGPKSASSFGLASVYSIVPIVMAKRVLAETVFGAGDDYISEYIAEQKSLMKLGSDQAESLLAMRYYGTCACPPAVAEWMGRVLAARSEAMAPRFCRKCGGALAPHAMFCSNCGTAISAYGGA